MYIHMHTHTNTHIVYVFLIIVITINIAENLLNYVTFFVENTTIIFRIFPAE